MLRQMPARTLLAALTTVLTALVLGACGSSSGGEDELVVSAATSLKRPFTTYGATFDSADVRLSFAGSDELAAQIRAGARPDVFAAANTALPDELHAAGLLERPRTFAANRLVLAVPAGSTTVRSLDDLARPGVTVVTGAPSVPIGAYTRAVLGRLGAATRARILANVRSQEPDVGGIAAKLTQRAGDAGFLYATDVAAANGRLRAIELPARLRPAVAYAVAVVRGAPNPAAARAFVNGLLAGAGADALRAAGFAPPPR